MFQYKDNRQHPELITDPLFPRLKVDIAQTGFFAGREFRTFYRFSIPTEQTLVIKAVVDAPVILFGVSLNLILGEVDMETRVGGTEGGAFSTSLPVFNRNNIPGTPTPSSEATLTAGGTHTGGTVLDVLQARTSNIGFLAQSVGNMDTDERGIAPGTYYFVIDNIDGSNADGVFKLRWQTQP